MSKLINFIGDSDFLLDVDAVTVVPENATDIAIVFTSDDDSNEQNETLTLILLPKPFTLQTFPRGEAVFFVNTMNLTIIDAQGNAQNYFASVCLLI